MSMQINSEPIIWDLCAQTESQQWWAPLCLVLSARLALSLSLARSLSLSSLFLIFIPKRDNLRCRSPAQDEKLPNCPSGRLVGRFLFQFAATRSLATYQQARLFAPLPLCVSNWLSSGQSVLMKLRAPGALIMNLPAPAFRDITNGDLKLD